jgi:hypothetical protein
VNNPVKALRNERTGKFAQCDFCKRWIEVIGNTNPLRETKYHGFLCRECGYLYGDEIDAIKQILAKEDATLKKLLLRSTINEFG